MNLFRLQGPKRTTVKKELKEKRESNEESKENLKAKSDDSGEEKNGDEDSQKNGPKKKGEYASRIWHVSILKSLMLNTKHYFTITPAC